MASVKLRCIMGCPGLKSSYQEKGLLNEKSSNGIANSNKIRKSKYTQEKLKNQIIGFRKSHQQKYQKSKVQNIYSNTDIDNIPYTDKDRDNITSRNKSNLPKCPKDNLLIVGDFMILGTDEKRSSRKC